jgi:Ser/Thr protein kinase RdoA (MazF antagonist)
MFLTESNLLPYLLERRFADLESVVGGEYEVWNLSRRNRNFRVVCGERAYFIKQPKNWDAAGRRTLEQEAALYWQARVDPGFRPLKELMPESYGYDPQRSILTLQYLAGPSNLFELEDRFAPEIAQLAGSTMGTLHREMPAVSNPAVFPRRKPWYLTLHQVKPDADDGRSEGQREVVRMVQKHPEFGQALDALREGWRQETAIHGDWKLENCLYDARGGRIQVIDWELANWGDRLDDVGTLLQSWWGFWVRQPGRYPIETIRPALRAFLEGYAAAQECDPASLAFEAIPYAGARMLQSATEAVLEEDRLNGAAVCLLQASLNILTRPQWAFSQIFGAGWN